MLCLDNKLAKNYCKEKESMRKFDAYGIDVTWSTVLRKQKLELKKAIRNKCTYVLTTLRTNR